MIGMKDFHAIIINLSNRIRGKVARIHKIENNLSKNPKIVNLNWVLKKIIVVSKDMNKMFLYSLKKINVKALEPNSVLNPLTNSLSLSLKS